MSAKRSKADIDQPARPSTCPCLVLLQLLGDQQRGEPLLIIAWLRLIKGYARWATSDDSFAGIQQEA
jgi:hypothetical protein